MAEKRMNAKANESKPEKLTYEQLEQIANELNGRCQQLYQEVRRLQAEVASFDGVNMLLDIISHGEYFDPSFVERCARRIQDDVTAELDKAEKQEDSSN